MKLDRDSRKEMRQLKAVQQTVNDKRLLGIWGKSPYIEVRIAVIYKLKDQIALSYIAQNETMDNLRCEAVKKLENKALLAKTAMEDKNKYVRYIANRKLEYAGSVLWDGSEEVDEDVIRALRMIYEHNVQLIHLATGEKESEGLW